MMRKKIFKTPSISKESKRIQPNQKEILHGNLSERIRILREEVEEKERFLARQEKEYEEKGKELLEQYNKEVEDIRKEKEEQGNREILIAKDMYEDIVSESGREKERLLEEAKKESESIVNSVETVKINEIKKGKKEGYDEGYALGLEKGREQSQFIRDKLERVVVEVLKKRDDIIDEMKGDINRIIINLSRRVLKKLSSQNKETALFVVEEYLNRVKGSGKITIRVNTRDVELLETSREKFQRYVDNLEMIDIVEDSSITEGGCIIETAFTKVDARIETQLAHIENAIIGRTDEST